MSRDELFSSAPFSYVSTKSGLVQISWQGRVVTTLSGREAERFLRKVASGDPDQAQLVMAKATGHFKHGTEQVSANRRSRRDPADPE